MWWNEPKWWKRMMYIPLFGLMFLWEESLLELQDKTLGDSDIERIVSYQIGCFIGLLIGACLVILF